MKRLTAWSVSGLWLLAAMTVGCTGSEETPKGTKFEKQVEPKKERKPQQAIGQEPTEKIPPMPGKK